MSWLFAYIQAPKHRVGTQVYFCNGTTKGNNLTCIGLVGKRIERCYSISSIQRLSYHKQRSGCYLQAYIIPKVDSMHTTKQGPNQRVVILMKYIAFSKSCIAQHSFALSTVRLHSLSVDL